MGKLKHVLLLAILYTVAVIMLPIAWAIETHQEWRLSRWRCSHGLGLIDRCTQCEVERNRRMRGAG